VAQRLLDAGKATPEAVLRARADRADVEQQLAESKEREAAAARELNRILHRPLDAPVDVVPDAAFDRPLPLDADAAVAHALAAREELSAGDAGVRVAEAAKRAVTSRYLPTVSFAFDYGFQGQKYEFDTDQDYWMASLVAQWSLVDLSRDEAHGAAAYDVERARNARADAEDRIRVEVRTAHEAATVAQAAIATADARLDAARRTFELVRRRYEEGVASPIELVDARTTFTSADLNRALTAYRYAMRWVDLERAAALRDVSF
jgi:outer membrane protein TolC